jgi:dihydrofolate synthase/folylpolyglutamate synthase
MLANILTEAGYKTGLYTSPVIHTFGERMQVNRVPVTEAELVQMANHFLPLADRMEDPPTEFEVITAMSLFFFYQKQCDIVVLEVGLGGRLDATNIIETPEAAVITAIGLDHMVELGNTVEKIAGEKAGIIKADGLVVCQPQTGPVLEVFRLRCASENTELVLVDSNAIVDREQNLEGQFFDYKDVKNVSIPLLGRHQLNNAAAVIETVWALQKKGWRIPEEALRNGFAKTKWLGRFEVMRRDPVFIVDSAHNPQGIQTAVDTLCALFPGKKFLFLFGVLADKDHKAMLEILKPYASGFVAVTPEDPRALPAEELDFIGFDKPVTLCASIAQGVQHAINISRQTDVICSLGSLSMVGRIRECLQMGDSFD